MTKYKYFIISDVLGHYNAMMTALNKVGYNEENPRHILITLGNMITTGDQNRRVLEFLIKQYKNKKWYGIAGPKENIVKQMRENLDSFFLYINQFRISPTLADILYESENNLQAFGATLTQEKMKKNEQLSVYLDNLHRKIRIGNYRFLAAGKRFNSSNKKWEIDESADPISFINYYTQPHSVYVLGSEPAFVLNQVFYPEQVFREDEMFRHESFININANTAATKVVNVLVIETEDKLEVLV